MMSVWNFAKWLLLCLNCFLACKLFDFSDSVVQTWDWNMLVVQNVSPSSVNADLSCVILALITVSGDAKFESAQNRISSGSRFWETNWTAATTLSYKFGVPQLTKFRKSNNSQHPKSGMSKSPNIKIPMFPNPRIPKFLNSQIPWVPKFQNAPYSKVI